MALGEMFQEERPEETQEAPETQETQEVQEGQETQETQETQEAKPPEIPDEVRQSVRQEVEQEILGGWSRDQLNEARNLRQWAEQDPSGFAHWAAGRVPELAQRLHQPQQQQPQQDDLKYPEPVLDQYTGQRYYSQEQLQQILRIEEKKAETKFNQLLDERVGTREQQEQQVAMQRHQEEANQQIEHYSTTLPKFQDMVADGSLLDEMRRDGRATPLSAWRKLYDRMTEAEKKQTTKTARESTLKTIQGKARAATEDRVTRGSSDSKTPYNQMRGVRGFEAALADAEAELSGQ